MLIKQVYLWWYQTIPYKTSYKNVEIRSTNMSAFKAAMILFTICSSVF